MADCATIVDVTLNSFFEFSEGWDLLAAPYFDPQGFVRAWDFGFWLKFAGAAEESKRGHFAGGVYIE